MGRNMNYRYEIQHTFHVPEKAMAADLKCQQPKKLLTWGWEEPGWGQGRSWKLLWIYLDFRNLSWKHVLPSFGKFELHLFAFMKELHVWLAERNSKRRFHLYTKSRTRIQHSAFVLQWVELIERQSAPLPAPAANHLPWEPRTGAQHLATRAVSQRSTWAFSQLILCTC